MAALPGNTEERMNMSLESIIAKGKKQGGKKRQGPRSSVKNTAIVRNRNIAAQKINNAAARMRATANKRGLQMQTAQPQAQPVKRPITFKLTKRPMPTQRKQQAQKQTQQSKIKQKPQPAPRQPRPFARGTQLPRNLPFAPRRFAPRPALRGRPTRFDARRIPPQPRASMIPPVRFMPSRFAPARPQPVARNFEPRPRRPIVNPAPAPMEQFVYFEDPQYMPVPRNQRRRAPKAFEFVRYMPQQYGPFERQQPLMFGNDRPMRFQDNGSQVRPVIISQPRNLVQRPVFEQMYGNQDQSLDSYAALPARRVVQRSFF